MRRGNGRQKTPGRVARTPRGDGGIHNIAAPPIRPVHTRMGAERNRASQWAGAKRQGLMGEHWGNNGAQHSHGKMYPSALSDVT